MSSSTPNHPDVGNSDNGTTGSKESRTSPDDPRHSTKGDGSSNTVMDTLR